MHPKIIYTIAGVCLMAGVMMSAKIKVRFAALIYTGVLGYLALNAYTNKEFNYSKHVRVSMVTSLVEKLVFRW